LPAKLRLPARKVSRKQGLNSRLDRHPKFSRNLVRQRKCLQPVRPRSCGPSLHSVRRRNRSRNPHPVPHLRRPQRVRSPSSGLSLQPVRHHSRNLGPSPQRVLRLRSDLRRPQDLRRLKTDRRPRQNLHPKRGVLKIKNAADARFLVRPTPFSEILKRYAEIRQPFRA
jgi:hypothetical protein